MHRRTTRPSEEQPVRATGTASDCKLYLVGLHRRLPPRQVDLAGGRVGKDLAAAEVFARPVKDGASPEIERLAVPERQNEGWKQGTGATAAVSPPPTLFHGHRTFFSPFFKPDSPPTDHLGNRRGPSEMGVKM